MDNGWQKLTYDQIIDIEDKEIRKAYLKKVHFTYKHVINPLYMKAIQVGKFEFSTSGKNETVEQLVVDLKIFFNKNKIGRDEIYDAVLKRK